MAWWKRRAVPVCEVCGAKLRTGSAILVEKDYFVGRERKTVRDVCEACRRRLFPTAEEVLARLRDGDAQVRTEAVRELARHRHWGAVGHLRDALVREGWPSPVGREIIKALVALRGPEAERAVIAVLHNASWRRPDIGDQVVASEADSILSCLLDMGGSALAVRALCDTVTSPDVEVSIRGNAARYLSGIAYNGDIAGGASRSGRATDADRALMVERLRPALRDESAGIRQHAASALGHLGDTNVLEDLIDALGDENGGVRHSAARALGDLGDSRAAPALRRVAKEKDGSYISVAARKALEKLE